MSFDYLNFAQSVRSSGRFIHEPIVTDFLSNLKLIIEDRVCSVPKGTVYFRAQGGVDTCHISSPKNEDCEFYCSDNMTYLTPYSNDRMKPIADKVNAGRANPYRIPFLYVADNKNTAMTEIRPYLRRQITLAMMKVQKELRLIDLSIGGNIHIYLVKLEELEQDKRNRAVLSWIDNAFSLPVDVNDSELDYIPTQIISELIKSLGYDGIIYRSSLSDGKNIVLFELSSCDLIKKEMYETTKITHSFSLFTAEDTI